MHTVYSGKVGLLFIVAGMVGAGQARADLMSVTSLGTPYSLLVSESAAVLAEPDNSYVSGLAG